jgi:hypothetical protein
LSNPKNAGLSCISVRGNAVNATNAYDAFHHSAIAVCVSICACESDAATRWKSEHTTERIAANDWSEKDIKAEAAK